MHDVYSTPQSDLTPNPGKRPRWGSVEDGINGNYEFTIGGLLSESWEKTKGAKLTLNLAFTVYFVIALVVGIVVGFLGAATGSVAISVVGQIVMMLVSVVMTMGMFVIGLKYAIGAETGVGEIFRYFGKIWPLFLGILLIYLLVFVGMILLVLPGIYLAISYYLALPLIVEKNMPVWQAMEASRKAISKRWFSVFGLFLVLGVINMIGMIPFGIGLFWTMPMTVICFGMLYRNMFGYEPSTLEG